jgi:hypothetical protein
LRNLVLALLLGVPAAARAECVVPSAFESLAEAVAGCPEGEVVFVEAGYQPYRDAPYVLITRDLHIEGEEDAWPDLPNLEVRGADLLVERVAFGLPAGDSPTIGSIYASGGSIELVDVRLEGADVGKAGLYAVGADVTLTRVEARDFAVTRAVHVDGNGFAVDVAVAQSVFDSNLAGAIALDRADATITTSIFRENYAPYSPDLYAVGDGHTVVIDQTTFTGSIASGEGDVAWGGSIGMVDVNLSLGSGTSFTNTRTPGNGGAIALADTAPGPGDEGPLLDVKGTIFELTHADLDGGAVYAFGYDVTLGPGTQMVSPSAGGAGGGLAAATGVVKLDQATLAGCDAVYGGAVALEAASATFEEAVLTGGVLEAKEGGLVHALGSDLWLDGTRLADASAFGNGGAVFAGAGSAVTVTALNVEDVRAGGAGGFLYAAAGVPVAVQGGSSLGTSAHDGGGFLWASQSAVSVADATIEGASSQSGAGALHLSDPTSVTIEGSRFCGVASPGGAAVELEGRPTSGEALLSRAVFLGHSGIAAVRLSPGAVDGAGAVKIWNADFVGGDVLAEVRLLEPGADLRNLLFVGSDLAVDAQAAATGGYALYSGVGARFAGDWPDEGSRAGDPRFVGDPAGGCDADLSLGDGSAAIDAGDPAMPAPDGRIDIGAIESGAGAGDTDGPSDGPPQWITGGGGCAHRGGGGIAGLGIALASAAGAAGRRRRAALR